MYQIKLKLDPDNRKPPDDDARATIIAALNDLCLKYSERVTETGLSVLTTHLDTVGDGLIIDGVREDTASRIKKYTDAGNLEAIMELNELVVLAALQAKQFVIMRLVPTYDPSKYAYTLLCKVPNKKEMVQLVTVDPVKHTENSYLVKVDHSIVNKFEDYYPIRMRDKFIPIVSTLLNFVIGSYNEIQHP